MNGKHDDFVTGLVYGGEAKTSKKTFIGLNDIRIIVSSSLDKTIKFWNFENGELIRVIKSDDD